MQATKKPSLRNESMLDLSDINFNGKNIYECLGLKEEELLEVTTILKNSCRVNGSKAEKVSNFLEQTKNKPYAIKILAWLTIK